jgi:molybdopterin-containing oxidoreductase family membrane subunit
MDEPLIARGLQRMPFKRFLLWLLPWFALLGVGAYAGFLCLYEGLNQTNMDNRFAFGLWIYLDLTVIALGAGAFFTGFLLYVLKKQELQAIIRSAVVIGFICYSGAVMILAIDVGQPLRSWFTFWHPNIHSMLTEVTFCLTCYLTVLAIEYLPIVLRNRQLRRVGALLVFEHELHKWMVVLALVGTFLSFFHQGSLGGLYGVLQGRPFAYRAAWAVWPSTFFLFVLSAAAVGPSFILLLTWVISRLARKPLVKQEVFDLLGRVSGKMLIVYVLLKSIDSLIWLNVTAPARGVDPTRFYVHRPYGAWMLLIEIIGLGLLPALILINARLRRKTAWLIPAAALACAGIVLNRFIMTVQTLALPTLAFDAFLTYTPSWQEVASFGGVLAYGVILYSLSFRYLNLFPQEQELRFS